ncbi:MAG: SLC13 family permease, partial [Burkholderiaceae bacterium]|nr:SLC13 family permease [Burkholderiaceae bacterium]
MPSLSPAPAATTASPASRAAWIAAALLLAGLAYGLLPLAPAVRKGLALLVLMGVLWLSEALPLAVTALLVPLGALALGIPGVTTTSALAPFADPIVFLFLGGFALATALHAQQLDRKMALALLALSRGHLGGAVAWLFAATAVLSMGISNTATAAMMLPLALGMLDSLEPRDDPATPAFVLLGVPIPPASAAWARWSDRRPT